jgi:transmembrane sensor
MNYRHYTTEDFIADDYFRQWAQYPDKESNLFWEEWIRQHPEKFETLKEAKSILQFLYFKIPQPEHKDYLDVKRKIKQGINKSDPHFPGTYLMEKSQASGIAIWRKAAAFFVGITLLGIMYFFFLHERPTTIYATKYGEIRNIVLPDSSMVTLNANSTLTLSSNWRQSREVWLEGEAFFAIEKLEYVDESSGENPSSQPVKFIVHTDNLDVEVLGTRFNVNERRGMTKVVLNSGRVQLKNNRDEEIVNMQPGDFVAYSKTDRKFLKQEVDPKLFISWKEGRFAFEGTPIREIAQMLEDNYGYEVKIGNQALASRKFTADIPSHDVGILLILIAESLDVKAEKINNEIEIKN